MFLFFLLLQLLNAQTIEFDIRDNSLYKYNQDTKQMEGIELELDSVKFYNSELGIDTTLKYSKNMDLMNILISNSINNNVIPLEINLSKNSFSVKSYEIIKNIKIYDLLGNEIVNQNIDSKEVNIKYNFNNFLYFVQIETTNNMYKTKILKTHSINYFSNTIKMNENNWKITLYKFAFKPKTLEFKTLPNKIEYELERIKLKIEYDFEVTELRKTFFEYYNSNFIEDTINSSFYNSKVIFDTISKNSIRLECQSYTIADNRENVIRNYYSYIFDDSFKFNYSNNIFHRPIIYYIDSLYKLNSIMNFYCNYIDDIVYYSNFEFELKKVIDLKPFLENKVKNESYIILNEDIIWEYKNIEEDTYYYGFYKSESLSKIASSKLSGTINISLVD